MFLHDSKVFIMFLKIFTEYYDVVNVNVATFAYIYVFRQHCHRVGKGRGITESHGRHSATQYTQQKYKQKQIAVIVERERRK